MIRVHVICEGQTEEMFRQQCPLFHDWVTRLESLTNAADGEECHSSSKWEQK